uniref:Solute carrier family 5 member 8 n=1 Tax=Lates calcarifer TaxID=8187 RepID=A0A4W6E089_LATCA
MSGGSPAAGSLMVADYVVFALMLLVSAAVGVYYAWVSRGRGNSKDFLTGSRKLTALPVSMSLTASFMSSTTLLANPAEVYRYGAIFLLFGVSYVLAMVVTSELFLPFFYRLSLTSTYEYLELRFNRATRLLGTVVFMIQAILYTGIIIYGPALALQQVIDMDLWGGIISTGAVCILFDINPLRRHTFWTMITGGTFGWVAIYGVHQAQVQRYVSCKSITHARIALYINLVGLCSFLLCSVFAGMCLYSIYKDCDPWTAGHVSAPDELMPYLVVDIFTGYPGLKGLFFAAVYSGSLSTVSSSINALAAVTLEDLIKPYTNMSEKHLTWVSKGLSFFYGVVCITMAGLASLMGGMMQAGAVISGITLGPLLGLFTLGILCPFANSKGGLSGLVTGLVAALAFCLASLISPPIPEMTRPLPMTTEGCNFATGDSLNWTSTALPTEPSTITTAPIQNSDGIHLLTDKWQSPSYLYLSVIGTATAFIVGLMVSLFTGGWKERVDLRLTLMREDTTIYHIFKFFKGKVMRRTEEFDLTKNREEKSGNTNPAFYDTEMDSTISSIPK